MVSGLNEKLLRILTEEREASKGKNPQWFKTWDDGKAMNKGVPFIYLGYGHFVKLEAIFTKVCNDQFHQLCFHCLIENICNCVVCVHVHQLKLSAHL